MGALTSAAIAIAGVILGWITLEIACKPCLERGREALDRELNPDYDPDDAVSAVRAPLNPPVVEAFEPKNEIKASAAESVTTVKLVKTYEVTALKSVVYEDSFGWSRHDAEILSNTRNSFIPENLVVDLNLHEQQDKAAEIALLF